ncbi:MAG: substrate-binding domain-containing protein, partial [Pirellulales bacterium]
CYSDLESTLLVHGLWQVGVSIPGDVSLIGFNDVFGTRYMTPPLTTVGFDAAKIGEMGAQLVLKDSGSTAEEKQPTVFTIKPKLIVRGSTGPAKSRDGSARNNRANSSNGHAPPADDDE